MGKVRTVGAWTAIAMVAACGSRSPTDTASDGSPATGTGEPEPVPTAPVAGSVASSVDVVVCEEPPFGGMPGPNSPPEDASTAGATADAHRDLFAGVWWDGSAGEFVFATVDVTQAAAVLANEVPADFAHRVEEVGNSAQQLEAIQRRTSELLPLGIEASSSQRVWDGTVEIGLPILDEPSLQAVGDVFAGELDAVCVSGADPATVPPDGPQPAAGDGWRLLADQTRRGEPYAVHVALNAAEYTSLWASLALDGQPPPVDFDSEIVIHFGAVYSGSCPEIRLDDVVVDDDGSSVSADIVQLGGARDCTADANPRAYVLAIAKDRLPQPPFSVSLGADCPWCEQLVVTSVEGNESSPAQLSESDRWQILSAAVEARVTASNSFGGQDVFDTVDVVEVLGRADADGFVRFDDVTAFTDSERNAITQALAPRSVRFVPAETMTQAAEAEGYAVLSIAEPVVIDGHVQITTALWCGGLCGVGGANVVDRSDDGTWTVAEATGPQWIS